ncbi:MFS transporter [Paenibacillus taichungensis]|uniref:MFS transporter n=1 Tax=Paenibacillus taichungensis TaxID=484184 RepID=UPI0038D15D77
MFSNFKVLRNKNLSLLITSESTSLFGTLFLNIALSLYVLKMTGSSGDFASVLALGVLPHIILGSVAGILADKFDKKSWIIIMDILRGAFCLFLFFYCLSGTLSMPIIYFTVLFISMCDILFAPVFVSVLPTIVPKEDLVDANSISRTLNETMKILAPLLGTLVYTWFGLGPIFLVNALTFVVSAVSIYLLKFPPKQSVEAISKKITIISDISIGFRVIFGDARLTSIVSNAFLTHTFLYPFLFVGVPYIIINVLLGSNTDYGVVESLATIGSLMAIFIVPLTKKFGIANNIGLGLLGMLIPVLLLMFLGNPWFIEILKGNSLYTVSYFSLINFILFLSFSFYVVYFASYYQSQVPKEVYGRFIASVIIFNGIGKVIGYKVVGLLFETNNLIYPVIFLLTGMTLKLLVHIPFMIISKRLEGNKAIQIRDAEA